MVTIKRVFDYYQGLYEELFWNFVDNSNVINKCPLNGKNINYKNSFKENEELSDLICRLRGEVPEPSLDINIPSPCDGCGCLNLAHIRVRSGCNPSGDLKYCFDDEPFESCPGNCEYEVIGICKRFYEFDPNKVTLLKWM
jgi:hypothetical protein